MESGVKMRDEIKENTYESRNKKRLARLIPS